MLEQKKQRNKGMRTYLAPIPAVHVIPCPSFAGMRHLRCTLYVVPKNK
jgi:hypothetical protein